MYGILEANLTEDLLREIAKIYDEVAGANSLGRLKSYPPNYMFSCVKGRSGNAKDFRFGSRLSIDSKLMVWEASPAPSEVDGVTVWQDTLRFSFDPEVDHDPENIGRTLNEEFIRRVDMLLVSKGLAVPVRR